MHIRHQEGTVRVVKHWHRLPREVSALGGAKIHHGPDQLAVTGPT